MPVPVTQQRSGEADERSVEPDPVATQTSGIFKAVPILLDDSLPEDGDVFDQPSSLLAAERQLFLRNMLLADQKERAAATAATAALDSSNTQQLSEEQTEAELIIMKKKAEEEQKRKEFEHERKRKEAELLKKASEMKRKRDKEDIQMQKELQLKRLRQEEARRKVAEEKRVQEEINRKKEEEEIKKLEKLETYRRMMLEREDSKNRESSMKREIFNKHKDEILHKVAGGRTSSLSNSLVSSPISFEHQVSKQHHTSTPDSSLITHSVESQNLVNNQITSLAAEEASSSHRVPVVPMPGGEVEDMIVADEDAPPVPPPPLPPPPVPSPPLPKRESSLVKWESQASLDQAPESEIVEEPLVEVDASQNVIEDVRGIDAADTINNLQKTDSDKKVSSQNTQLEERHRKSQSSTKIIVSNTKDNLDQNSNSSQDVNANFLQPNTMQSPKSGFSLGWRDVRTGLVKNRSSNYLKVNKSQITNYGRNVINKSSSWIKSRSKSKSPEPVLIGFKNNNESPVTRSGSSSSSTPPDHTRSQYQPTNGSHLNDEKVEQIAASKIHTEVDQASELSKEEEKMCNTKTETFQQQNLASQSEDVVPQNQDVVANKPLDGAQQQCAVVSPQQDVVAPWRKCSGGGAAPRSNAISPSLNLLSIEVKSNLSTTETIKKQQEETNLNLQEQSISHEVVPNSSEAERKAIFQDPKVFEAISNIAGIKARYEEQSVMSVRENCVETSRQENLCLETSLQLEKGAQDLSTAESRDGLEAMKTGRRGSKGTVRSLDDEDEFFEDSLAFEDDFSIGIELPGAADQTSGNVTPIPTTGELEELSSIDEPTVIDGLSMLPVVLMDPCIQNVNSNAPLPGSRTGSRTSSDHSLLHSEEAEVQPTVDQEVGKPEQTVPKVEQPEKLEEAEKDVAPAVDNVEKAAVATAVAAAEQQPAAHHQLGHARTHSRSTPLKSLLKKPSVDRDLGPDSDSTDEGQNSPKKVHFSEVDQIKLMSQDSLASMVASECSSSGDLIPVQLCKTVITSTPAPSVAKLIRTKTHEEERTEHKPGGQPGQNNS